MAEPREFDPRKILAALDRHHVSYVLIGGLARVLRGTDEVTDGVDICPSVRPGDLGALAGALDELGARRADRKRVTLDEQTLLDEPVMRLRTSSGVLQLVAEPAGTRRGYVDLRRASTVEHIGHGLRPRVASVADLARMSSALGRERDLDRSRELRRIMELELGLHRRRGRERTL